MKITLSDAHKIAAEVAGSIDWQTKNVIEDFDNDGTTIEDFIQATRPTGQATVALCKWMADRSALKAFVMAACLNDADGVNFEIRLMATTANSIARVLEACGYDDEAEQIMAALQRHDAAAVQH